MNIPLTSLLSRLLLFVFALASLPSAHAQLEDLSFSLTAQKSRMASHRRFEARCNELLSPEHDAEIARFLAYRAVPILFMKNPPLMPEAYEERLRRFYSDRRDRTFANSLIQGQLNAAQTENKSAKNL